MTVFNFHDGGVYSYIRFAACVVPARLISHNNIMLTWTIDKVHTCPGLGKPLAPNINFEYPPLPHSLSCSPYNLIYGELSYCISCVFKHIGEVCVGSLPTWAHQVRGNLCIIDETTMVIRNFRYDSGGPGQSYSYTCVCVYFHDSNERHVLPWPQL